MTNAKLKYLKKLKNKNFRDQENFFIIEGFHLVEEALKKDIVVEIYASVEFKNAIKVSQSIIDSISSNKTSQPIIAICKKMNVNYEVKSKRILVLENINDPGNLGTLVRSAFAFGFNDVIVEGVDIYNHKFLQASQGAFFYVNLIKVKNAVDFLKSLHNYQIYVTTLRSDAFEYDAVENPKWLALVLGNEANGISLEMEKLASKLIYIKTNFESLNVASAGAILLNHFKNLN
ncbi:TrmH family RNA methyltransferase [[Mycoplasma] mobile]|uniref:SpoU class tRNA/rRNA methylase n=1 Tax=Mycoplasma mobile (strain ATCC 43663 / 163K / NCTC 11711) TaxID=267748 RepID=Q6KIH0_MYCM1|nr:RNA methyltransferase [[Mycoplasma] mobile]AAT27606.1 spoU class tRNA/rRNA methylase [Mycoplasma mobile 163K]